MKLQRRLVGLSAALVAAAAALAAAVGFAPPVFADDSAVEGTGGAVRAMTQHPSVVMESEVVNVRISRHYADVHCRFVFRNDGPATTVKMGFPESGSGDVSYKHPRGFLSFSSLVDGKPVRTTIEGFTSVPGMSHWQRWRTKTVRFGAGQTRRVAVSYRQRLGAVSDGSRFFEYVLTSGASWKDKIGHAKVVIRFVNVPGYATEDGAVLNGASMVREWRDFEPRENINVGFLPAAPPLIVNGRRLKLDVKAPPLPRAIGDRLLVRADKFAVQVGGALIRDPEQKTAMLKRGTASVPLMLDGHKVPGIQTLRSDYGALVVDANEIIKALGGDAHWEDAPRRLVATLPPLSGEGKRPAAGDSSRQMPPPAAAPHGKN